ncbi:MAG: hypothetical protein ACR2GX_03970 [Candidatus Dormibacteria bacterium]
MGDAAHDSDDQVMVGKVGRVTGIVAPGRTGEVMVSVRGGTEAFLAYPVDGETISANERVVIIEYHPPRTVYVSPA